jgi:hypothetical protein
VSEGSKTVTLPGGLGDVTLSLFKKASIMPIVGTARPCFRPFSCCSPWRASSWVERALMNAASYRYAVSQDDATVYLIEQTQCAEATLPAALATVVEQALHAQVGTCADQGYSVSEGSKTVTLPGGLGDVTLSLFKKASASLAIPSYGEDQPFPELGLQLGMVEQPTPDSGDHHQQHEHGHGQHHHHDHEDSDHHHHGYDGSEHRQHGHGHGHDDRQGANAHGNAHGDCPFKKCFRLAKDLCHLSRHQHHEKIQCLKDHAAELPADCQLVVAYVVDAPVPQRTT